MKIKLFYIISFQKKNTFFNTIIIVLIELKIKNCVNITLQKYIKII